MPWFICLCFWTMKKFVNPRYTIYYLYFHFIQLFNCFISGLPHWECLIFYVFMCFIFGVLVFLFYTHNFDFVSVLFSDFHTLLLHGCDVCESIVYCGAMLVSYFYLRTTPVCSMPFFTDFMCTFYDSPVMKADFLYFLFQIWFYYISFLRDTLYFYFFLFLFCEVGRIGVNSTQENLFYLVLKQTVNTVETSTNCD